MSTRQLEATKKTLKQCAKDYSVPLNPALDESVLYLKCFPKTSSKKMAFIMLTYKRDATSEELGRISSQPAGLVRDLRNDGFIFKGDGKGNKFLFKNSNGKVCRRIDGYKPPKHEIKGKIKAILEKSVAACVSAIEIYNKPDFKYREETFSILIVNAWELLLKAKILAIRGNEIGSILIFERGKIKLNRAGNPKTIDIRKAMLTLYEQKILNITCQENINLLIEIRDNAIHFINKNQDLNRKVLEIGTAGLSNYVRAISEWFDKDLSRYNFYLMPMSFFHLTDIESSSTFSTDKQIENILKHFQTVESQYSNTSSDSYSITLRVQAQFVKASSKAPSIPFRHSTDPKAPEIRITEEDAFRNHPLDYKSLTKMLENRYTDFKLNQKFHKIKKELEESQDKNNHKYCRTKYLRQGDKKSPHQTKYAKEILDEFDRHYTIK